MTNTVTLKAIEQQKITLRKKKIYKKSKTKFLGVLKKVFQLVCQSLCQLNDIVTYFLPIKTVALLMKMEELYLLAQRVCLRNGIFGILFSICEWK